KEEQKRNHSCIAIPSTHSANVPSTSFNPQIPVLVSVKANSANCCIRLNLVITQSSSSSPLTITTTTTTTTTKTADL
uniref:Ovule protein n=1 Tax=Loa loa TaxID=7209 RepID=A0A1I7VIH8_LOALO